MKYTDLLKLVRERRSIRRFKIKPVSRELIEKILEVARWAPSGANSQPWKFIVVDESGLRKRISEILIHPTDGSRQTGFRDASVFILVCGDSRTRLYYPFIDSEQQRNEVLISSWANVFLYIQLATKALGLGSRWVSRVARKQSEIKNLLGIPDVLEIYDMAAIGYPDEGKKTRLVRSLEDLTHYNKYDLSRIKPEKDITDYVQKLRQSTR